MDFFKVISKNKFIVGLLLVALITRIIFVFVMPVKLWDETVYINLGYDLSKNPLDYSFANNGWSDFIPGGLYPKAGFRAPLLPYLVAFLYLLKINFLIDFIVPIFGAFSVLLIYLLGKNIFEEKTGKIAALFLAFIPLHAFYSGRVLTDAVFTFFVLLTFLFFWKGFEQNNKKYKLLFGLSLAITLLSRYTALWIMPVFFIYLFFRNRGFKFLRDKYLWYAVLLFILTLTPWLIYGLNEYGTPVGAFIHGAKASSYWGGVQPWHFYFDYWWAAFSVLGYFSIVCIIYLLYKKEYLKKEVYFILIWIVIFLGLAIYMPHKEDRFILAIAPALSLISAHVIKRFRYAKVITLAIVSALVISTGAYFYYEYKLYNNINSSCFEKIGAELKNTGGDFMIVSENPSLFRYYAKQESAYYPDVLNKKTIKELESISNKTVFFVFTRYNSGFEEEKWKELVKIMKENYTKEFECPEDPEVNWIYSNKN